MISKFLKSELDKEIAPSSAISQEVKSILINFGLCSIPEEIPIIPEEPNILLFDIFIFWIFLLFNKIWFKYSELDSDISKNWKSIFFNCSNFLHEEKNVFLFSLVILFVKQRLVTNGWFFKNKPNSIIDLSDKLL